MTSTEIDPTDERTTQHESLIALVNSTVGRDDEFRDWYWGTHVAEVLELPGFISARTLRLAEEPGGVAPYRYATIYEIEGSAIDARDLMFGSGLAMSEAMDVTSMIVAPFAPPAGDPAAAAERS